MKSYKHTGKISSHETQKYFKEHTILTHKPGFHAVTQDLKVFKKIKVFNPITGSKPPAVIANLVIPAGSIIRASVNYFEQTNWGSDHRKMRANRAIVQSMFRIDNHQPIQVGCSSYNKNFKYLPGLVLKPNNDFSWDNVTCSAGIHFFLNVEDAVDYHL